ncbi:MAG: class I SAM-dependent methyltransferase, partial [Gammaproteobacteria bacterium]|nr:class I SAM-dependent methyltransferase [Gammaproteobacteria bacterium]
FTREYRRYKNNKSQSIDIGHGPLTLLPEKLADDHYDEGISFFQNFLDKETMSYSMAYYDEIPFTILASNKSLAEAQTNKFKLIAKRMKLKDGEKLLNFGCGFGYFESYLLNNYPNLQIASLTHSKDQHDFIIKRKNNPADPLSSDRFQLYFGEIDSNSSSLLGKGEYDVVSSVGLMEHINNVELFFKIIDEVLVEGGRMFHHLIVSRDLIPQLLDSDTTLIGDYFPGGKVLPFQALQQGFNNFSLDECWFINGMNYWRTLDQWHSNFWKNLDQIYPDKMDCERVRHWNNYFVLCKAMFFPEEGAAYGNGQYLFYK